MNPFRRSTTRAAARLLLAALAPGLVVGCGVSGTDSTSTDSTSAHSTSAHSTSAHSTSAHSTSADSTSADGSGDLGRDRASGSNSDGPDRYRVEVLSRYPHDETSWTQGLEFHDGRLLESTGREGQSTLRLVDPRSGEAEELVAVDADLFAEGVTVVDDRALQLTWTDETLLVTTLPRLTPAAVTRIDGAYEGEGWGLCYDGTDVVMSDGSDQLEFRRPDTFEVIRSVAVTLRGEPLERLNELECVEGRVWANVWQTTTIVGIDPSTGVVEAVVDAAPLVPPGLEGTTAAVLNGIAHDPMTDTFWLTGKLWPVIYEVALVPVAD